MRRDPFFILSPYTTSINAPLIITCVQSQAFFILKNTVYTHIQLFINRIY